MRIDDLFEEMRPVATVWKKRGDTVQRGRISRFAVNLKPLTKVELDHEEDEKEEDAESDGGARSRSSGISRTSREN